MTDHIIYIDNIEDLVISKYLIEKKLIEQKKIQEKGALEDFVNEFINMNVTTAIYNINGDTEVVPFDVHQIDDDRYIFFATKNEYSELTANKLNKINYDVSHLKEVEPASMASQSVLRINDTVYDF